MEKTIEELREKEDHLNDIIEGCKDSEEDLKTKLKKYRDRTIIQENIINDLKKKLKQRILILFKFYLFLQQHLSSLDSINFWRDYLYK